MGAGQAKDDSSAGQGRQFQATHWSQVLRAAGPDSTQAEAARAGLCETYWYPIYCYVRHLGLGPEDAQDLTQEFFSCVLQKHLLQTADPAKGKFRSFLLTLLNHFMADQWRRAHSRKREPVRALYSLDTEENGSLYLATPADEMTPEKAFEKRWAIALMDKVLSQLRAEFAAAGRSGLFDELQQYLSCRDETSYAELARRLDLPENNLRVAVHRLRKRFRELLRAEIARTVAPDEVDEEIRFLFASLSQ